MVSAYLDVAEIQALNQIPMKMEDWAQQLNDFLKMTKKEILIHKGTKSHKEALKKAHEEYDKYFAKMLTMVEKDYIEILKKVEKK